MDVEVPEWLTDKFLKNALRNVENNNEIEIANFQVERAVPKGNNYTCILYRVKLKYSVRGSENPRLLIKSLMVKAPIKGGLNDCLLNFGIIQKEVLIYNEYIPKLCQVLGDESEYVTPTPYYLSTEENIIVTNDLNADGFKMANRLDQFDYDHTVITLKYLAKFHAASVKLHEQNSEFIEKIGEELIFCKDSEKLTRDIFSNGPFELIRLELSTWSEAKQYEDPIRRLSENAFDKLRDCFEKKGTDFNVLCHGDFWLTNILFKYNEFGSPVKAKFVDFQISRYASPALDLIYLFTGSVQEEIRTTQYERLVQIYVDELNENLLKLNCERRTNASHILEAIQSRQFYTFYANITLLPTVVQDTDTTMEIKEMTEDNLTDVSTNPFRKYLQTEKYRKLFLKRINEFSNILQP